jgi:hypothetical protein
MDPGLTTINFNEPNILSKRLLLTDYNKSWNTSYKAL